MKLHIVGGFLGSGKTTAIIGAAKQLMDQGQRVGVVTNDQGRYLVDTAFFELSTTPTVEVTGGCFCCNYDDLDAQLEQLKATAQPDVIFAESVGSCADIVATVVKPLLELRGDEIKPSSFSVFTDVRLLRRRLLGQPMPFSDDVVYIFDKQIEESGLLVINKVDLLDPEAVAQVRELAAARFPEPIIRTQNSLNDESIAGWVDVLTTGSLALPARPLDIDYVRYGTGEAQLAWLDERVRMQVPEGGGREGVLRFLETIVAAVEQRDIPIGHLKILIQTDQEHAKVSFASLEDVTWREEIPPLTGTEVDMLINARLEVPASELRDLIAEAADLTTAATGVTIEASDVASFHPAMPTPTHRFTEDA
jgi:Ni2+-binding GTPase involved in maturation of urease and hydrogenase